MLEFVQQENDVLALTVDLLEQLIESERVQPFVPLQGCQELRDILVRAMLPHQPEKPMPQLDGAHRIVDHLEIGVHETYCSGSRLYLARTPGSPDS